MRFLGGRSGNKKNPACACGHARLNHWDYKRDAASTQELEVLGPIIYITKCRFQGCDCEAFEAKK